MFSTGNYLISYGPFGTSTKLLLADCLIAIPWTLACADVIREKESDPAPFPDQLPPAVWILGIGLFAAIALRAWTFKTAPVDWNADEGDHIQAVLSILDGKARLFFQTSSQNPPVLYWLLALGYRLRQDPSVFQWVMAVVSMLPGFAAWIALRHRIGPRWAALAAVMLWLDGALCFFSLKLVEGSVLVVAEVAALSLALGREGPTGRDPGLMRAVWIGCAVGFSVWTYVAAWAWVFGCTVLAFGWALRRDRGFRWLAAYGLGLAAFLAPFILSAFRENYGQHVRGVSALGHQTPIWSFPYNLGLYEFAFLWGGGRYQWAHGGFLHPLLGALCFLGLLELVRRRKEPGVWALGWLGFTAFLPAMLSVGMQSSRASLIIPFHVLLAILGFGRLTGGWSKPWIRAGTFLLVLGTAGWNAINLRGINSWPLAGHSVGVPGESGPSAYQIAYRAIEEKAGKDGPGYLWTAFCPRLADVRLWPALMEFNACLKPAVHAKWAAMWIPHDLQPFLDREWPGGEWIVLSPGARVATGAEDLVILPCGNEVPLARWNRLHGALRDVDEEVTATPEGGPYGSSASLMEKARDLARGDRFLEAVYWEKMAWLYRRDRRYQKDSEALRNAAGLGVSTAHLDYEMGLVAIRARKFKEARGDFRKALARPLNTTAAAEWLPRVDYYEKHPELILEP